MPTLRSHPFIAPIEGVDFDNAKTAQDIQGFLQTITNPAQREALYHFFFGGGSSRSLRQLGIHTDFENSSEIQRILFEDLHCTQLHNDTRERR